MLPAKIRRAATTVITVVGKKSYGTFSFNLTTKRFTGKTVHEALMGTR